MTRAGKAALLAAVLASVMSDAAALGLTRDVLDFETGPPWAVVGVSLLLATTYLLLAAVLAESATVVDGGRGAVRWIRRALRVDLLGLAAVIACGPALIGRESTSLYTAWGMAAGVGFAGMFLLSAALGISLLRRRELRVAAVTTASVLVVIPLTIGLASIAPDRTSPAYAESVVYIGIALLGRRPAVAAPRRARELAGSTG